MSILVTQLPFLIQNLSFVSLLDFFNDLCYNGITLSKQAKNFELKECCYA